MAYRRLSSLLRTIQISSPLPPRLPSFASFSGSQASISGFSFKERFNFASASQKSHWAMIAALLFSTQAVMLSDEGRLVFAQDNSNSELVSENKQNEDEAYVTGLKKIEDGSIVSNEHTIKWRMLTDTARDLFQNGKIEEAEKAFKLALEEAKKGFGYRDPHVASSCNNLAEFYRVKKEFEKAEPLYLEGINILEESLGTNDVRVGAALHNLGQFYLAQHKFDQAQTCYERALKIKGQVLGDNNPDYASTMHHLGRVLYLQGKEKDAIALISESIKILEENGLGESPTCLRRMRSLSQILIKSNKPDEAEIVQRKILHALELLQGWDSLETVMAAENLALTLQSLGSMKESQELLERCLQVRKKLLSEDHIQGTTFVLQKIIEPRQKLLSAISTGEGILEVINELISLNKLEIKKDLKFLAGEWQLLWASSQADGENWSYIVSLGLKGTQIIKENGKLINSLSPFLGSKLTAIGTLIKNSNGDTFNVTINEGNLQFGPIKLPLDVQRNLNLEILYIDNKIRVTRMENITLVHLRL